MEKEPKETVFECDWCGTQVKPGDPCAFIQPNRALPPEEHPPLVATDHGADVPGGHDLVCADCTDN